MRNGPHPTLPLPSSEKVVYVTITAQYGLGQRAKFFPPAAGDPALEGGEERMRREEAFAKTL